jgi:predicted DCC family thiol-disulfide oxidoreductase YuxK
VLHLAASLPFPYRAAVAARLIPLPNRDFAYGLVARYRRRFPGQPWCALPPSGADLKDRILG